MKHVAAGTLWHVRAALQGSSQRALRCHLSCACAAPHWFFPDRTRSTAVLRRFCTFSFSASA